MIKKMKRYVVLFLFTVITLTLSAEDIKEKYRFLTESPWDSYSEIDWNNAEDAYFEYYRYDNTLDIYKRKRVFEEGIWDYLLTYIVKLNEDDYVWYGYDYPKTGEYNILKLRFENSNRYILENKDNDKFISGAWRGGDVFDKNHPLVGRWTDPFGKLFEVIRHVNPAEYIFVLDLPELKGYSFVKGDYLLKYVGDNTFESDATFPEGHIRLEVRDSNNIIITPLYEYEGKYLHKPLRFYPVKKRS